MRDDADDNLSRRLIGKIQNSIVSDAILKLLAARRERLGFQRQNRSSNALLHGRRQPRQLFFRISREPDAPAHTRIPRSFNTFRTGSRVWCRRDSSARVSAKSCARSPSASSFSRTASRSLRFNALKAVTKTSAVASVAHIQSTLAGMPFHLNRKHPTLDQSQRSSHRTAACCREGQFAIPELTLDLTPARRASTVLGQRGKISP